MIKMEIKGVDDYVVDAFGNPIVYDERKSEEDLDGLNFESFVLISGGAWDRKEEVSLKNLDKGDLSMFLEEKMENVDTKPEDYKDTIPSFSINENDDIFNM